MRKYRLFFYAVYASLLCLLATENLAAIWPFNEPPVFYIGPEVYYLKRKKKGGTRQDGYLGGVRAFYERRHNRGLYWAIDALYSYGSIPGKTKSGKPIKSHLTETEIEGRFGYSLCFHRYPNFSFTPYGGYGGYYCKNDFKPPSPLCCVFHDKFDFALGGFVATKRIKQNWEVSLDFQVKYMLNGCSKVTHDPIYSNSSIKIHNEVQYEGTLPIIYTTCWKQRPLKINFGPFFRYRHFGGMITFPHDFIDTRFYSYGAHLLFCLNY